MPDRSSGDLRANAGLPRAYGRDRRSAGIGVGRHSRRGRRHIDLGGWLLFAAARNVAPSAVEERMNLSRSRRLVAAGALLGVYAAPIIAVQVGGGTVWILPSLRLSVA